MPESGAFGIDFGSVLAVWVGESAPFVGISGFEVSWGGIAEISRPHTGVH